jgi:hypothetical protein
MAKIVGIHGIGQQVKGGYTLREVWFPALKDGLVAADRTDLADELSADDMRVAPFGSLFRKKYAMGDAYADDLPSAKVKDLRSTTELELVADLYDAACAQEPALGSPVNALGPGRDIAKKLAAYPPVQVMVERVLRSRTFAGSIPDWMFAGNLKQVLKFLTDAKVKELVLKRVHEYFDENTRIVIGHSLGSVVAYEYLCRHRPASVQLLVTLGSPLGIPNVVFEKLTPTPREGRGAWPGWGSMMWVNVADPGDVVALRKDLAPLFPPSGDAAPVSDRLVDNDKEPHGIVPYLNAEQTGSAVATAL